MAPGSGTPEPMTRGSGTTAIMTPTGRTALHMATGGDTKRVGMPGQVCPDPECSGPKTGWGPVGRV